MAVKAYQIIYLDQYKKIQKQIVFSPAEMSIRKQIIQKGGIPLSIKEKKKTILQHQIVRREYKIKFLRSILFNVNAGLSAGESLIRVIELEENSEMRRELEPALNILRQGGTFSDAIDQVRFFDRTTLTLLKVADRIGNYKESLQTAIDYLENKKTLWKSFSATLGWLSFDIFTAVSSVLLLKYKFFPWIQESGLTGVGADASQLEKFQNVLKKAMFATDFLLISTFVVVALLLTVILLIIFQRGKAYDILDNILVRLPIVKNVIYDGVIASTFFSRTLMSFPLGEPGFIISQSKPPMVV